MKPVMFHEENRHISMGTPYKTAVGATSGDRCDARRILIRAHISRNDARQSRRLPVRNLLG